MNVIFEHERACLLHGDSKDLGAILPENSVDAIVCDPPAGVFFMSSKWDHDRGGFEGWTTWLADVLAPAYRALKPGGHAIFWALPRTSDWTMYAIRKTGFEIRDVHHDVIAGDTLLQAFLETLSAEQLQAFARVSESQSAPIWYHGFATGFPKSLTSKSAEIPEWAGTALKPAVEHWILARKPLDGTVADNFATYGTGVLNIDGCRIGTSKSVPASASTSPNLVYGWFRKGSGTETSGSDPNVGRWPAHLSLEHAPGCTELDVVTEEVAAYANVGDTERDGNGTNFAMGIQRSSGTKTVEHAQYVCVEGCPVRILDEQSGTTKPRKASVQKHTATRNNSMSGGNSKRDVPISADGGGGASRFFYCSKAARSEKDAGLEHLTAKTGGEVTGREDDSAGVNNPRAGAGRTGGVKNFHPCLPPGEVVRTDLGWQAIETVHIGDRVLSHDGTWCAVTNAFSKPCDDGVMVISVDGENRASRLTRNHPLLIWRVEKRRKGIIGGRVQWLPSGDVRPGDYTMTPIVKPGMSEDRSVDWWWALGLWLAEGSEHTSKDATHDYGSYPAFGLHINETTFVDRLKRIFGDDRVRVYPASNSLGCNVVVLVKGVVNEWIRWCGKGSLNKRVPVQVWEQDAARREALLEGYLNGDGCVIRGYPRAKSASEDLAIGIATLAETCGWHAATYRYDSETGTKTILGRTVIDRGHVATYLTPTTRSDSRKLARPRTLDHDGTRYTLRRVESVEHVPYTGPVYNLTIGNTHTFQVRIGMSHNTSKSISLMSWLVRLVTPPGGTVLDPFAGSGTTGIAAIKEGMNFIGCEMTDEYLPILLGRIRHALGLHGLEVVPSEPSE